MSINTFYKIWLKDFLYLPIAYFRRKTVLKKVIKRNRISIENKTVYVNIHEWGGYPLVRTKNVKDINSFKCGLIYQLNRFKNQTYCGNIDISVTISDIEKYTHIDKIKKFTDKIIAVENTGMDFSGYANFFKRICNAPNAYIILTNSSINKIQYDFLDSYISYMEENPDVGLLGISSSSMYYHTLLRHNFNPHIQSFFILTTISVLNEIISLNKNRFPGINETNKHLLIREGEVKLSALALELGYKLAIVQKDTVSKFDYSNYPLPLGDFRKFSLHPNTIYPILLNSRK